MTATACPTTGEPVALCNCATCEPAQSGARSLRVTTASDVVPRPVRWLLDQRIPLSAVTLLAGREGLGKSTLWAYWAAAATHGTLDGHLTGEPTDVVVIANEDTVDQVLTPRLIAAGADLRRVRFVDAVTATGDTSPVVLPLDTRRLHDAIDEYTARLVIVDPLVSVLDGSLDSHKDHSIRQALDPINRLASSSGAAVVGLVHLNKGQGTDILDRVLGSRAFTAAARSVIGLVEDPDDDGGTRRLVIHGKSNLGQRSREAIVINVSSATVDTDEGPAEVGVIEVIGTRPIDLDDAMTSRDSDDVDDLSDAARWLLDYLWREGGQAKRSDVIDAGKKADHSREKLRRAAKRVGVVFVRASDFKSSTTWFHPDNSPHSTQSTQSTQSAGTPESLVSSGESHSTQPSVVSQASVSGVSTVSSGNAFPQSAQSTVVCPPTALTAPTAPTGALLTLPERTTA